MARQYSDPLFPSLVDHPRRRLLQAALAAPVLLLPGGASWALGLGAITRLHPVRFLGGLVLDFAAAVLVEVAANYVADQWRSGSLAPVQFNSHTTY